MTCVFCEIVAGRAPASVVFEDERTMTFLDHRPVTPGHLLVVPRRHSAYLADLDPEDGAQLFRVGMRGAAALRESPLRCEGVNFHLADGEVAGQEVFHVHLHVIARFAGDGFGLRLPLDYRVRERTELDDAAAMVRGAWDV
ncbi:MAG: HIT family protein [Actinobacteria bacterium]|nr:MAG: HIT family protein [Actinomycetota bacterium]